MIREIELTNFQGFKGHQAVRLAPLTLVFGANASGKSSISRALRLLKQTVGQANEFVYQGGEVDLQSTSNTFYGQGGKSWPTKSNFMSEVEQQSLDSFYELASKQPIGITAKMAIAIKIDSWMAQYGLPQTRHSITTNLLLTNDTPIVAGQPLPPLRMVEESTTQSLTLLFDRSLIQPSSELTVSITAERANRYGEIEVTDTPEALERLWNLYRQFNEAIGYRGPDLSPEPPLALNKALEDRVWRLSKSRIHSVHERNWRPETESFINPGGGKGVRSRLLDVANEHDITASEIDAADWWMAEQEALPTSDSLVEPETLAENIANMFGNATNDFLRTVQALRHIPNQRPIPPRLEVSVEREGEQLPLPLGLKRASEWLLQITGGRYAPLEGSQIFHDVGGAITSRSHLIEDRFTGTTLGYENVGSGLSQIVPILLELGNALAKPTVSGLIIEQPELHLHPQMQADLASIFIDATQDSKNPLQLIVETHSEAMLLRIQKAIRSGALAPRNATIVFVEPSPLSEESPDAPRHNIMRNIEFTEDGELDSPMSLSFAGLRLADLLDS